MPSIRGSRTSSKKSSQLPPFLLNLWTMLEDRNTDDIISWSEGESHSFVVKNTKEFEKILGRYFKHSKFASFVRQLNMYDFYKVRDARAGATWSHPSLKRGNKQLLYQIKRKNTSDDHKSRPKPFENDTSRLQYVIDDHENRINELESELKYAKRVQRQTQNAMSKAFKQIYSILPFLGNPVQSHKAPATPMLIKENSGKERSPKRNKSNNWDVVRYSGSGGHAPPSLAGSLASGQSPSPFSSFPAKSERSSATPLPRVEIPGIFGKNSDPPHLIMDKESSQDPLPSPTPMEIPLSPSTAGLESPLWKFPFSPNVSDEVFNDDFHLDASLGIFDTDRPLSPATEIGMSTEDDEHMTDDLNHSNVSDLHDEHSLTEQHTQVDHQHPETIEHEGSSHDDFVSNSTAHFSDFRHEFRNDEDFKQNVHDEERDQDSHHAAVDDGVDIPFNTPRASSTENSDSNPFNSSPYESPQHLPPPLSFTEEQIQQSPDRSALHLNYIPPPPNQTQDTHHSEKQSDPEAESFTSQSDTDSSSIPFTSPTPFSTTASTLFNDSSTTPFSDTSSSCFTTDSATFTNTSSPSFSATPFSTTNRDRKQSPVKPDLLSHDASNSTLMDTSLTSPSLSSFDQHSSATNPVFMGHDEMEDVKENELSSRFQTIQISAGEADPGVRHAEALVQQLLKVLSNTYAQKGVHGLFPSNYDGFGCWFTNLKTPPSVAPHVPHVPPEPWAILLYGLKDANMNTTAVVG